MLQQKNVTFIERKRTLKHVVIVNTFVVALTMYLYLILYADFCNDMSLTYRFVSEFVGNEWFGNKTPGYLIAKDCHPYFFIVPCLCIVFGGYLSVYKTIEKSYLEWFYSFSIWGIFSLILITLNALMYSYTHPIGQYYWQWVDSYCESRSCM